MNVVISIAGSDSGGGAGIQADLKTFEAHGVYGTTAITSITAQNTLGVRAVFDLPLDIIAAQLEAVFDDFTISAVKIGMLSIREIIHLVADFLKERASDIPIVLDPVMIATSGDRLLQEDAVKSIIEELLPLATLITPNIDEAVILAGMQIGNIEEMHSAAEVIVKLGVRSVLVKGGHLDPQRDIDTGSSELTDVLYDGSAFYTFRSPFIPTTNTHGTGCTLSSAIAANFANGSSLTQAIERARDYVHKAIESAPGLGQGQGPLRHGWELAGKSDDA